MDSVPLYVTLGSIAGFLSFFLLFILHFPEVVDRIKQFIGWLWRYMGEIPKMIRNWWLWRQCKPTWQIHKYGDIKITKEKAELDIFSITISITVSYHNSDKRYALTIDRDLALLLYHGGRGKEGKPIQLTSSMGTYHIKPLDTVQIEHNLNQRVSAKPLIERKAYCKLINKGDAWISTHSHYLSGNLKRVGSNKFVAKIKD